MMPTGLQGARLALLFVPISFVSELWLLPTPPPAKIAPPVALVRAVVFNGDRRLDGHQRVIIRNGEVVALGPDVMIPAQAVVVDVRGDTILPGLIDGHVHAFGGARADALRFGVTTLMDMFGLPSLLQVARGQRQLRTPTRQADLFGAGYLATVEGGHGTQYGFPVPTLTSSTQADSWVDARLSEGSDYIKVVYGAGGIRRSLDRATLGALVKATHARRRKVYVHAVTLEAAEHAIFEGADALVHVFGDAPASAELLSSMKARDAFVVSTLAVLRASTGKDAFAPPEGELSPEQEATLSVEWPGRALPDAVLSTALANVAAFHRAGIPVIAGSDAPNPGTAQGVSLYAELRLLVKAGLSPQEALRAATGEAARVFGLADRGCVEVGCRADLLRVAGDPTEDITAVEDLVAVWKNGASVLRTHDATLEALKGGPVDDWGTNWVPTSDRRRGGRSTASIPSTGKGRMRVVGEVRPGSTGHDAGGTWAGASLPLSSDWGMERGLDGIQSVHFQVRGTPGTYRFLILQARSREEPAGADFPVTADWQPVHLLLTDMRPDEDRGLRGISVVTGGMSGRFELEVRELVFE